MILERLVIERTPEYKDRARPLFGRVKFSGGGVDIELPIGESAARRILELAADGMVDAAGQVAALTRAQVIDAVKALPDPTAQEAAIRG